MPEKNVCLTLCVVRWKQWHKAGGPEKLLKIKKEGYLDLGPITTNLPNHNPVKLPWVYHTNDIVAWY